MRLSRSLLSRMRSLVAHGWGAAARGAASLGGSGCGRGGRRRLLRRVAAWRASGFAGTALRRAAPRRAASSPRALRRRVAASARRSPARRAAPGAGGIEVRRLRPRQPLAELVPLGVANGFVALAQPVGVGADRGGGAGRPPAAGVAPGVCGAAGRGGGRRGRRRGQVDRRAVRGCASGIAWCTPSSTISTSSSPAPQAARLHEDFLELRCPGRTTRTTADRKALGENAVVAGGEEPLARPRPSPRSARSPPCSWRALALQRAAHPVLLRDHAGGEIRVGDQQRPATRWDRRRSPCPRCRPA